MSPREISPSPPSSSHGGKFKKGVKVCPQPLVEPCSRHFPMAVTKTTDEKGGKVDLVITISEVSVQTANAGALGQG